MRSSAMKVVITADTSHLRRALLRAELAALLIQGRRQMREFDVALARVNDGLSDPGGDEQHG